MNKEEWFPLIDEQGNTIGKATPPRRHNRAQNLPPPPHPHIINNDGELYLQKRSVNKDIQPSKWDTAVGGHIDYGETVEEALAREVREELGITHFIPIHVLTYIFESDREREMVNTFYTVYTGKIQIDPVEIDDGRFWTFSEIHENMGKGIFTPNFEQEFLRIESRLIRTIKQGTMKKDCE